MSSSNVSGSNASGRGRPWTLPEAFADAPQSEMPLLPSAGAVAEAAAFGAAMGGVGAGISEGMAVRAGEKSKSEAMRAVARAGTQGAVTMSVASVVAHVVRAQPLLGVGLLAALGVGAFVMFGGKSKRPAKSDDVVEA